jgi:hypothetical protein
MNTSYKTNRNDFSFLNRINDPINLYTHSQIDSENNEDLFNPYRIGKY